MTLLVRMIAVGVMVDAVVVRIVAVEADHMTTGIEIEIVIAGMTDMKVVAAMIGASPRRSTARAVKVADVARMIWDSKGVLQIVGLRVRLR